MSLSPDYFVVSTQCPELYEVLKRIFNSSFSNVEVVTKDFRSLREEK